MEPGKITKSWLKRQKYQKQNIYSLPTISGVVLKELTPLLDSRGELTELWSKSWVKKEGFVNPSHCYQSTTDYGVVKCWHLHAIHTDQLAVTRGKIQLVLVDLRNKSKTFGHVNSIFMGTQKPRLLKIPPGIMHGWKSLSRPEVIVVNFQSHVYDPNDEYKYPWNCVLKNIWGPING
ncbi:dTDP-4-dehydrorhamnose 3,5-epimerase family protein [Patescibacteria group bacterium]